MYRSCILAVAAVAVVGSSCLVSIDAFARGSYGGVRVVHAPPTHTANLGHSTSARPWTRPTMAHGGFQCLEKNAQVNHAGTTTCQDFSYWGDGSAQPCKMGSSANTSSAFCWTCVAPTEAQWQAICVQSFDEIQPTGTRLLALARSCAGHLDGLTSFREFCAGPVSERWIQNVQQQACTRAQRAGAS